MLLPSTQAVAAFADDRVIPIRQAGDEIVDISCLAGRLEHGLVGFGLGIE